MSPERKYSLRIATILVLFFILSLTAIKAGFAQSSEEAYRVENFDVNGDVSLEVQTSGGSIKVIGTSDSDVRVKMFVRKRGRYIDPGEADLSRYNIEISQEGNTIKAISERNGGGWNWNNGYSIGFKVYSPNNTRSRLRTSGGSLSVENLTGSQELNTSGGSISAERITGIMDLKTSGGSISVSAANGNVKANTSGGTIRAESIVGDVDLRTSGGSISMEAVEGRVDARTSGGSIRAEILAPSDHINLRTSGGSISIQVPEGGYDLDLDGSRVNVDLVNFTGSAERDEVEGTINGGGISISARTSGGSVNLDFK